MIILRALLYSVSFVIHHLPYSIQCALAWCVGILWFDILRIRRKDAIRNVKRVFPNLTEAEACKMARRSLFHMGLTLIEFYSMPFLHSKEFRDLVDFEGEEHLQAAVQEGKGVFLLAPHTGNGDFGTAAMASWGYKVHIISKVFQTQWLNDLWFAARRSKGVQFIPPRKSSYEILKALKAKEIVIFVLDQYTGPPNGILTTFFGYETGTAVGLALFAQRSGAPVLPIHDKRIGNGRHKITCGPPIIFEDKGDKDETLRFMTEKYNRAVEKQILDAPEQWMWVHRRWKYGFEGQKPLD